MANWRRKVIALFPDLRRDAERPGFTVYFAFFDLLPRVRAAHQAGDAETLRRVYGFAEWCFKQKAKDMWNAAGVAFYEHLFDSHRSLWPEVVRWLSPRVVADCWGLWEWRLPAANLAEVRRLLDTRRNLLYPTARLRHQPAPGSRESGAPKGREACRLAVPPRAACRGVRTAGHRETPDRPPGVPSRGDRLPAPPELKS